jgi:hypothetical protein
MILTASCMSHSTTGSAATSSKSGNAAWTIQDGSVAAAERLACGPRPAGSNAALVEMLAGEKDAPASAPPLTRTPRKLAGAKEFDYNQVFLNPPGAGTKPLACADEALVVADSEPVAPAAVKQIWLGSMTAKFPSAEVDGVDRPFFSDLLVWVVVTDAAQDHEGCPCTPPAGSTEVAYIDATTGQRLFATGYDVVLGPADS